MNPQSLDEIIPNLLTEEKIQWGDIYHSVSCSGILKHLVFLK